MEPLRPIDEEAYLDEGPPVRRPWFDWWPWPVAAVVFGVSYLADWSRGVTYAVAAGTAVLAAVVTSVLRRRRAQD